MRRRLADRGRLAVDELVGPLALAELLLAYRNPEAGGDLVAEALDLVRPVVRADVVEVRPDHFGGRVDAVADGLLGRIHAAVELLDALVEEFTPVRHQCSPPGCVPAAGPAMSSTALSASSRSPAASMIWLDRRRSELFRSRKVPFQASSLFSEARS